MENKPKNISKASYFKDVLRKILIGGKIILDHKRYSCSGWGQRCTLAHYASELKRKGEGEYQIKHSEPGVAEVIRIK